MLFSKKGKSTVIILKKIKTQQGVTEFWVALFLLTSFYAALKENPKPIFTSRSVLLKSTPLTPQPRPGLCIKSRLKPAA
jgi:hypothetical protein